MTEDSEKTGSGTFETTTLIETRNKTGVFPHHYNQTSAEKSRQQSSKPQRKKQSGRQGIETKKYERTGRERRRRIDKIVNTAST
jgi:hypothetical protein